MLLDGSMRVVQLGLICQGLGCPRLRVRVSAFQCAVLCIQNCMLRFGVWASQATVQVFKDRGEELDCDLLLWRLKWQSTLDCEVPKYS